MTTWTDYKNHVRKTNPEISKDIDEAEFISKIMVEPQDDLEISRTLSCSSPVDSEPIK